MVEQRTPDLFEVYPLRENTTFADLPLPANGPYYPVAEEGWFIYRDTGIGPVLLPENKRPKLGRIGYKSGAFTWRGPKVPARIISEAHNYFARIWKAHGTEAEVIITKHYETEEFRLFIPFQRANGMGVKSIFEPTHIQQGWDVIGTLHSHCNFSAFHSGTDTGDASDMDGVHFTIGHVDKDKPEIVAMVMMKGVQWDFKDPNEIAEIEFGKHTSPEWWDQYLLMNPPQQKPKNMPSISDDKWKEFLGQHVGAKAKPQTTVTKFTPSNKGWKSKGGTPAEVQSWDKRSWRGDEGWDWHSEIYGLGEYKMTKESEEFNRRQAIRKAVLTGDPDIDLIANVLEMAEESGAFNDQDWRTIAASDIDSKDFWIGFFEDRKDTIDIAIMRLKGETL